MDIRKIAVLNKGMRGSHQALLERICNAVLSLKLVKIGA